MSRQAESKLANKCINYLETLIDNGLPVYYEHRSGGGGFNYRKRIPDLFLVLDGVHVECELKTPKGRRSTLQEKWAMRFELLHIKYICPHTFEEFKEYIDTFLNIKLKL